MPSLYERIVAAESKVRALGAAQREMVNGELHAHSYWWAPFAVVGEAGT